MDIHRLKKEIPEIYRDYQSDYAYGFINGMIYASLDREDITEQEASDMNRFNRKMFNGKAPSQDYA